jgi:hypothetical protein
MSIDSSPQRFTETQGQYLAFIYYYDLVNRRPPAEADIQAFFGVTPPTVHRMIISRLRRTSDRRSQPSKRAAAAVPLLSPKADPSLQTAPGRRQVAALAPVRSRLEPGTGGVPVWLRPQPQAPFHGGRRGGRARRPRPYRGVRPVFSLRAWFRPAEASI